MHLKNLAIALGMTLGVQLVPGAWVKQGKYMVPNTSYVSKGGKGYTPGGSDYKSKTDSTGGSTTNGSTGTSGGSGTNGSGGSGTSGGGSGTSGSSGGGTQSACGPITSSKDYRGIAGPTWETNLNDALPYDWAKKFWLCGCPDLSLDGTGLYWQSRPIRMCMF